MSGDLAVFEVTWESREPMAPSDIDGLHVTKKITAVAAACCKWYHSACRSRLVASIGQNKDMPTSKDYASTATGTNHASHLSVLLIFLALVLSLGPSAEYLQAVPMRLGHIINRICLIENSLIGTTETGRAAIDDTRTVGILVTFP